MWVENRIQVLIAARKKITDEGDNK